MVGQMGTGDGHCFIIKSIPCQLPLHFPLFHFVV